MEKYNGVPCPVCGVNFTEMDDLVVCPDCGAPFHRECYAANGKCMFSEAHKNNFRWKSLVQEAPPVQTIPSPPHFPTRYCTRCDAPLNFGTTECHNCGASGHSQNTEHTYGQGVSVNFMADPLSYINPEDSAGEDISMRDMARLVGVNIPYYTDAFGRIHKKQQGKFNFAALFFSGFWLIHRKQYLLGGVVTFLTSGLSLIFNFLYSATISSLQESVGITAQTEWMSQQWMIGWEKILQLPFAQIYPIYLSVVFMLFGLAISIFLGFSGNRIYYHSCLEKIKDLKQMKMTTEEYHEALLLRGGVNMILAFTLFFILRFFPGWG